MDFFVFWNDRRFQKDVQLQFENGLEVGHRRGACLVCFCNFNLEKCVNWLKFELWRVPSVLERGLAPGRWL